MTIQKQIQTFMEENPEFPEYIIKEVEQELPKNVTSKQVEEVLANVKDEYEKSLISPYEAIGVITAQSVGERATQMTLNTFHYAGVATESVEGLPRIIEILDAKKNLEMPLMRLYLTKGSKATEDEVKKVAMQIKETKLEECVKETNIDVANTKVEIILDTKMLKEFKLASEDIVSLLDKKIKKSAQCEGNLLVVELSPTSGLKDLMGAKALALNSVVQGVKGIRDVTIIKEGEGKDSEFVIVTKGSAIKHVMAIEEIDNSRIYSNDIDVVGSMLGVEAARNVIIKELMDVVESQGLSINERHVLLIADVMTYTGEPRGMTRYGIVADKANVLTKASFETALKHIGRGAMLNERNYLSSITENVLTNQQVYVGTGFPKIAVQKPEIQVIKK
ncbi:MAG: hypothetical protein LAT82_02145 [Nanoarchaeota archaeon]|nr:hypothetical protein [Nanoarchaeota archaeon]